jgi:hypothetical protein
MVTHSLMRNKYALRLAEYIPYFALALFIAVVLAQTNPYTTLPSSDNGSFLYVGRLILQGKLLYINIWDSKPPGIFYLNALGLWLGRDTRWGVWLLQFVFLYATAVIGYRLLRKAWQPGAAVFGMIFWIWGLNIVLGSGDSVEEYPLLFNMAVLAFFWLANQNEKVRIYDFLIGLMTVLSFLFRADNVGPGLAIVICWMIVGLAQKKYRVMVNRFVSILAGAGVALLLVALFLWWKRILADAWNAAIIYNFFYINNRTSPWANIVNGFRGLGLVAWIALAGYGGAILFIIRGLKNKMIDPLIFLMAVLWPVEIYLSSLSGRGYTHYFILWLPAIALLCGYAYEVFSPGIFTQKLRSFLNTEKIPMILAVLGVLFINFNSVVEYRKTLNVLLFDRGQGVELINPISLYIRRNTKPTDTVLDWVQSGINYMSKRDSPTRYIWYPGYLPSPITATLVNGFYQDITTHPPEIIVDAYLLAPDNTLSLDKNIRYAQLKAGKGLSMGKADNIDQFFEFIYEHYKIETVINGFTVYRLIKP